MSSSSSTSLTTSCDTAFISSDSSTPSNDGPACLDKYNDTSLSFSQIFTPRRKVRACSVPHILPSVNTYEVNAPLPNLNDGNSSGNWDGNTSKISMSSSFKDIRILDGTSALTKPPRPPETAPDANPKFRRSSYSLSLAPLEDPLYDDPTAHFASHRSSIKKLFQAPSPRINQLKQEEGMERETTHERSTHINLLLSNTWEDLALDGLTDKDKNGGSKNNKDSPMSDDHLNDPLDCKSSKFGLNVQCNDAGALLDDNVSAKGLLSPCSSSTKSNPYLTFRAISSPTGKSYASRRSLSPVIILKPSSISIKRKYDSDNDSCASSPPTKKHQSSYSLHADQCNNAPLFVLNSLPGTIPFDNQSLPPSPGRLFDFAAGTSRSSSPCCSEEFNRGYESKVCELDPYGSVDGNYMVVQGGASQPALLNHVFPPSHRHVHGGKVRNTPLRPGFSLNNIDCQDNKGVSHHSLRAKSLISPLSFRCFPGRDTAGSPFPSLWSPRNKSLLGSKASGPDESSSFEDGNLPLYCETPESDNLDPCYYVTSPSSSCSPLAPYLKTCLRFSSTPLPSRLLSQPSPSLAPSPIPPLHSNNLTTSHDTTVVKESAGTQANGNPTGERVSRWNPCVPVLPKFVPIQSSHDPYPAPTPQNCGLPLSQNSDSIASPGGDTLIDVGIIEATVDPNALEYYSGIFFEPHSFPPTNAMAKQPNHPPDTQMDIDGKDLGLLALRPTPATTSSTNPRDNKESWMPQAATLSTMADIICGNGERAAVAAQTLTSR